MSTIPSLTIVANKQTALAEQHRGTYEQAAKAAGMALYGEIAQELEVSGAVIRAWLDPAAHRRRSERALRLLER